MERQDDYKTVCDKCYRKTWYEIEQPCHYAGCTGTLRVIDNSLLDERFTPYYRSGERVEVEWKEGFGELIGYGCLTNGRKSRFYVGKSMGWKPIYLEILRKDSTGGGAICSEGIKSIRGLGTYE